MEYNAQLTQNERELLEMIRTHKDPGEALEIAITIILAFIQDAERGNTKKWAL